VPAPGAQIVEGAGRFLLPGLVDAHVHVSERDLVLFLANGVTSIRELNGSATHLALRARVAAGELLGPRLKVASPLLAGERQRWRHELLADPAEAYERALALAAEGYDALKAYDGLSVEVHAALAAAAEESGLPLVGHVPQAVGLARALAAGQGLEHADKLVAATMGHALDRAALPGIAAEIAAAEVTVTPTLASLEILSRAGSAEFNARFDAPELAYAERELLPWWESLRGPADAPARAPGEYFELLAELVQALHAAGVPLLVGTDTPNPLLVPGFSIHLELEALVAAGLPRAAVLRAATLGAAELLGFPEQGRIAPGQVADLVLVDADPLASFAPLRDPAGVCVNGRWLARAELQALIAPLARDD
jgi:imidazolonepropionase-like amidohydrolase